MHLQSANEKTPQGLLQKGGVAMQNKKALTELVLTGLFAAIIIIMAFTPLGYIPLGFINATIIQIPVILGALFCGPKKGAFLGFLFGFTSFLKNTIMPSTVSAFVFSPILAANLFGAKGALFSTFICFVPRILVGILPYFVYKGMHKFCKIKTVNFAVAGVLGAFVNTVLVMGSILILYKDAYANAYEMDPSAVLAAIGGVISFNGVIEAIVSGVIVSAVGLVLNKMKPIK